MVENVTKETISVQEHDLEKGADQPHKRKSTVRGAVSVLLAGVMAACGFGPKQSQEIPPTPTSKDLITSQPTSTQEVPSTPLPTNYKPNTKPNTLRPKITATVDGTPITIDTETNSSHITDAESSNSPEDDVVASVEPTETALPTSTPQPEPFTTNESEQVEEETHSRTIFEGNPGSPEGKALGDGGFRSDCDFGSTACEAWGRILWGPFAREFDQEDIIDNATYRVTIVGEGVVIVGATDSKMMDGNMFGLYREETNLSQKPCEFEFFWPGLKEENDGLNGYGFEIIVQQLPDEEKGAVSNIKLELVGRGNLTNHPN